MTPAEAPQRILVIGGTGMLRAMTLELCRRGHLVIAVARDARRLEELRHEGLAAGGVCIPVPADWEQEDRFLAAVTSASRHAGGFDAAIVWMHGRRFELRRAIASLIHADGRLLNVLGSGGADSAEGGLARELERLNWPCRYRQVILGFVREGGGSRWLSDEEICAGVLRAFDGEAAGSIVGMIEPWSLRP